MSSAIDSPRPLPFDEDLIFVERFLAGDESAFETLYAKYFEKVFALARGVLLSREEAQDATQEIFALIHRHLHRFDRRSRFSTWVFRIAMNRSIQESRKRKHVSRQTTLDEAIAKEAPVEPYGEDLDPDVQRVLVQLSPTDRSLLVLFYWEELSLGEIADTLGCGVNAAKTRLYRARERFRTIYEANPPQ